MQNIAQRVLYNRKKLNILIEIIICSILVLSLLLPIQIMKESTSSNAMNYKSNNQMQKTEKTLIEQTTMPISFQIKKDNTFDYNELNATNNLRKTVIYLSYYLILASIFNKIISSKNRQEPQLLSHIISYLIYIIHYIQDLGGRKKSYQLAN